VDQRNENKKSSIQPLPTILRNDEQSAFQRYIADVSIKAHQFQKFIMVQCEQSVPPIDTGLLVASGGYPRDADFFASLGRLP
jgi:hypothetical protein